jgi:RimJ/RimL family protein N-acetyltransferase
MDDKETTMTTQGATTALHLPRTTPRLVLRPPVAADLERVHAIHADPENNRFNPAGPMRDVDQARMLLAAWMGFWDTLGYGPWSVALAAAPDRVVGFGGLSPRLYGAVERVNLGYRFEAAAWGGGLATELARAALAAAFDDLGLPEVHALVRPDHGASIRVLEKAGMRPAGTLDDVPGQPPSLVFVARRAGG